MSGSVFLTNLDDYILPSQACVNPLVTAKIKAADDENKKQQLNSSGNNVNQKPTKSAKIQLSLDMSTSEFDVPPSILPPVKPDLIKSKMVDNKKVAAVSLNDCLACSGCITTAESVLIQEQSYHKLLEKINQNDNNQIIVVMISPNSRASIANLVGMSPSDTFLKVSSVLKDLGVTYVVDASVGNDIAMIESRAEFLQRKSAPERNKQWKKPGITTAVSSTAVTCFEEPDRHSREKQSVYDLQNTTTSNQVAKVVGTPSVASAQLPMLSSNCPGWICYAEKTQPEALPYISSVKSPQQIIGTLAKTLLHGNCLSNLPLKCSQLVENIDGIPTTDTEIASLTTAINDSDTTSLTPKPSPPLKSIYVVSVQPCFDKKLEASRRDFFHEKTATEEVDLVLSTTELWNLLELKARNVLLADSDVKIVESDLDLDVNDNGISLANQFSQLPPFDTTTSIRNIVQLTMNYLHVIPMDTPTGRDAFERLFRCYSSDGSQLFHTVTEQAGSGGYAEYLFKYLSLHLYGVNLWDTTLHYKEISAKNPDFQYIDLQEILRDSKTSSDGVRATSATSTLSNTSSTTLLNTDLNQLSSSLRFGIAYGFRNIQGIIRRLKRSNCEFDFVEVMACPSGCNNGGGQIKTSSSNSSSSSATTAEVDVGIKELPSEAKARVKVVNEVFHADLVMRHPEKSPLVQLLYGQCTDIAPHISAAPTAATTNPDAEITSDDILKDSSVEMNQLTAMQLTPLSDTARNLFHTRYHAVPTLELVAPLATKW